MSARIHRLAAASLLATSLSGLASAHCVDFDPPGAGAWPCCGAIFMSDAVRFETRPFTLMGGAVVGGGMASIGPSCSGGPGHSLWTNNVQVEPLIPDFLGSPGVEKFSFHYEDFGGNINLTVNGFPAVFEDFHLIPAAHFGAVGVTNMSPPPVWTGSSWRGEVILVADPGACILRVSFGGQELCVDDVCGDAACPSTIPCPADLDGDGVVGFGDLLAVLSNWGPCAGCPEDLDLDNVVGFSDLLTVLSNWGACP